MPWNLGAASGGRAQVDDPMGCSVATRQGQASSTPSRYLVHPAWKEVSMPLGIDLLHGTEVTNTHRTQKNGVIKAPTIHFPLDILLLLNRDSRGGRGGTNGRVAGG